MSMSKRKLVAEITTLTNAARLQEHDLYITEYLNPGDGFNGIMKHRFSDFQVNEIDTKNNILHLTSFDVPLVKTAKDEKETETIDDIDPSINIDEKPVSELKYPVTETSDLNQLTLLMLRKRKKEKIRIDVTDLDKKERTEFHGFIANKYGQKLFTNTVTEGDRKFIVIGTRSDPRSSYRWPPEIPEYLHFLLYKENIDTPQSIRKIGSILRINPKSIACSGNKDRRAVTTQRLCIRRVRAERLAAVKAFRITMGNFEYKDHTIQLGDLGGNRFRIALRNVEATDTDINSTMESLRDNGFINYYGLQRFGSFSKAPTHMIGAFILRGDWENAINAILSCRDENIDEVAEACKVWQETKDPKKAFDCVKRKGDSVESIILDTLVKQGKTSFVNALQNIPRNVTQLYLHAYQSFVFNQIISRRLKTFGREPIVGDLIYDLDEIDSIGAEDDIDEKSESRSSKRVHVLSDEDVKKYTIHDIVYPLPGHNVGVYPKNEIASWYEEILSHDNVVFKDKPYQFNVPGTYRNILAKTNNLEWKTVYYDNPSADLIQTDLQKLRNENTVESLDAGEFKAVLLQFDLKPCTFATMAIREITKTDTSASNQVGLMDAKIKKPKLSDD